MAPPPRLRALRRTWSMGTSAKLFTPLRRQAAPGQILPARKFTKFLRICELERRVMIISKYSKSYDTANGSEQWFEDLARRGQGGGKIARQRWEDDGGTV